MPPAELAQQAQRMAACHALAWRNAVARGASLDTRLTLWNRMQGAMRRVETLTRRAQLAG